MQSARRNADGRVEVFVRGKDNAIWHIWQVRAGGSWSAWSSLSGVFAGHACVGVNSRLELEVFARASDGSVSHNWQNSPGGSWTGWNALPGLAAQSDLCVWVNADARLEIFARGPDGLLWHNWQTAPSGGWSGWAQLPGLLVASDPCAALNAGSGRLEVFARGEDNALWHNWQNPGGPGGWNGWASLGRPLGMLVTSNPSVAQNVNGTLEVFVRAADSAVWHIWQIAPAGAWSAWASLNGPPGLGTELDPCAAQNLDGRLEVFARGGPLFHDWQYAPSGGWSAWASLGGPLPSPNQPGFAASDPFAVLNEVQQFGGGYSGWLEVFTLGSDGALWHNWQDSKGSGGWSGWFSLGSPLPGIAL
jgi:hypothetical protein